jgi:hypothetical protein
LRADKTLASSVRRNGQRIYVVRAERGANRNSINAAMRAAGAQVLSRGSVSLIVADSAQLDRISEIEGVASIENYAPRVKHNEYGGGVILGSNAANAAGLFAVEDVDGALVGGASLTAAQFVPIVEAAARS